MTETSAPAASKKKRERSPGYPYLPLGDCIDLIGKLNAVARTSEVLIRDVAEPWGLTPTSGSLLRYIAAVSSYGLISASGSGIRRKVKITGEGRRILEDERPGIREKLCQDAALKPDLIREIFYGTEDKEGWGHGRPSDNIAISNLKFDLKFTPDGAKRFLSVYDGTIKYIQNDEESPNPGSQTGNGELSDDMGGDIVYGNAKVGDLIQWESNGTLSFETPQLVRAIHDDSEWLWVEGSETAIPMSEAIVMERAPAGRTPPPPPPTTVASAANVTPDIPVGNKVDTFTTSEGDVVLSWPLTLSSDSLEDVEAWTQLILKKVTREVKRREQAKDDEAVE